MLGGKIDISVISIRKGGMNLHSQRSNTLMHS